MCNTRNIGFSLVELMVAVGIIGIIVALAVPRYRAHIVRGHRAEARVNLGEITQHCKASTADYTTGMPACQRSATQVEAQLTA